MKIGKNSILAIFLFAINFNIYAMEPASPDPSNYKWAALAGGVLLSAVGLKHFLTYIRSEPVTFFAFGDLPSDTQLTIVSFLGEYTSAKTLQEAGHIINLLAQTSTHLEQFINNSQNCLQLIKNLAKRFDVSDEEAAKALQTRQAKRRLQIQNDLFVLCRNKGDIDVVAGINALPQDVDVEFTYKGISEPTNGKRYFAKITSITPLVALSLMRRRFENAGALASMMTFLFSHNVDINKANKDGMTALMFASQYDSCSWAVRLLVGNPAIDINQQDLQGNTALMHCLKNDAPNWPSQFNLMHLLSHTDINPTLANFAGLTPLQAAQQEEINGVHGLVETIQEAIDKKYGK